MSFPAIRKPYAVTKALEIIGEATKNLPDSLKNEYPDVPWKFMAGIRDKVVHGYFAIDLPIAGRLQRQTFLP